MTFEQYLKDNEPLIALIFRKLRAKYRFVLSSDEIKQYVHIATWKALSQSNRTLSMGCLIEQGARFMIRTELFKSSQKLQAGPLSTNTIDPKWDSFKHHDDADYIGGILSTLDPTDRAILKYKYIDGMSISEIANQLNLREKQIYYLENRAIKELQNLCQEN